MKAFNLRKYLTEGILSTQALNTEATIETSPEDLAKVKAVAKDDDVIKVTEDHGWGSSDQSSMNKSIHLTMGKPREMPSPFDNTLREVVADAVDQYWDEWVEYAEGRREDLIVKATKLYLRAYFPEYFEKMQSMFSESIDREFHSTKNTSGHPNPQELNIPEIEKYIQDNPNTLWGRSLSIWKRVLAQKIKDADESSNSLKENEVPNSEILDVIDSIQTLIEKLKSSDPERSSKLFTSAGPLVKALHQLVIVAEDENTDEIGAVYETIKESKRLRHSMKRQRH